MFAQSSKDFQIYKFVYYVFAAITIASSVHIIITTMLLQVFGPGLAYFGPLGSMALAAEGMRQEQKEVIIAVIIMVSSFVFGTCWLYFCVMSFYGAVIACFGTLVAARYWYYFCERIYLRFFWQVSEDGAWNEAPRDSRYRSEDENPANRQYVQNVLANTKAIPPPAFHKKEISFSSLFGLGFGSKKKKNEGGESDTGNGMLGYIFRDPATLSESERASFTSAAASTIKPNFSTSIQQQHVEAFQAASGAGMTNSPVMMEGYFTTRGRNEQQVLLEARRWDRRYFVLYRVGEFYIYTSRQDYRVKPKNSIFNRPLRLIDFYVKIDNVDEDTAEAEAEDESDAVVDDDNRTVKSVKTIKSTATTVRGNIREYFKPSLLFRFQITLVPRDNEEDSSASGGKSGSGGAAPLRNHWLLRCDTEEELEIWLTAIRDVCPSCFRD